LAQLYDSGYQNFDLFSDEASRAQTELKRRIKELYERELSGGSTPLYEFRLQLIYKIKALLKKRPKG
jgi:hypothetical protein